MNQYGALLKNSQQELNRANALIKEDLISRSDVDSSLAARNQNRAQYEAARQQLELARVNLSYTAIKSPIAGRIGKVNIFLLFNFLTSYISYLRTIQLL